MKLKGKVALVTGAGKGIGKSIAVSLAKEGCNVIVNYASSEKGALEAVKEIQKIGSRAIAVKADISSKKQIDKMFKKAILEFGRIDILVNNAGWDPGYVNFINNVDEAFYDKLMDINLKGTLFCTKAAVKEMIRIGEGGKIINIGSVQSRISVEGRTVYAASKGAIDSLTRQLALELAKYKININTIAPGFIEIERIIQNIKNYSRESEGKTIPWGRVGLPGDITPMVIFLASLDSDYMTGQVITIDGGVSCKLARK